MPSLYQIVEDYKADLSKLTDLDIPPEALMDTIEGMQGTIEDKVRAVIAYTLQVEADAKVRKEHAKRMADSAKAMENRAESLRTYAQVCLMNSGLKLPLALPEFTVNLAKNAPSLEVTDEALVPEKFKTRVCSFEMPASWQVGDTERLLAEIGITVAPTIETTIDRRALLAAVKEATEETPVPGATISPTSYRLAIR